MFAKDREIIKALVRTGWDINAEDDGTITAVKASKTISAKVNVDEIDWSGNEAAIERAQQEYRTLLIEVTFHQTLKEVRDLILHEQETEL